MRSEVLNSVLLLLFFPERQVLLKKLNDRLSVSEGFFINIVDLFEGIRQCLLTKLTGLLMVVHYFVVEHREVKGKSQSDWVACVQTLRSLGSHLVVLEGTVLNSLEVLLRCALGNISIVISDHFVKEGFGFISGSNLHAGVLDSPNNSKALIVKFFFDLSLVLGEGVVELLVFWVLLNGGNGSNGSSLGTDLVLKSYRKQVSLFSGEVFTL